MYRFLQIFDRPVYHIRALAEQSRTLWEELWAYFRDRYFTLDIEGRYEHLDLGTGTLLSLRNIIVGIFVGIILAAAFASFDRNHLGGLVRKLVREDCLSPDKAKTLRELGYHRSPAVRGSLKRGSVLGNVVHCVEREQHEQEMQAARAAYTAATGSDSGFVPSPFRMDLDSAHFYIPDEQHYAAEVRFEKDGSGWRSFLLVLILSVVAASLVILFLPDILQLVDNMIGILKGDSKVLN